MTNFKLYASIIIMITIRYKRQKLQDSINKLQENSYNFLKKLELMKYAVAGFAAENSDAYFFEDFCNDVLLNFFELQDEIDEIAQKEFKQQLNIV